MFWYYVKRTIKKVFAIPILALCMLLYIPAHILQPVAKWVFLPLSLLYSAWQFYSLCHGLVLPTRMLTCQILVTVSWILFRLPAILAHLQYEYWEALRLPIVIRPKKPYTVD